VTTSTAIRPASKEAGLSFSGIAFLGAILALAPLVKGGNRPFPLLILELAAIGLFCILLVRPHFTQRLSRAALIALGILVALPVVQLIPIPESIWAVLPGRDYYLGALKAVGVEPAHRSLSLIPKVTESAWLVLLQRTFRSQGNYLFLTLSVIFQSTKTKQGILDKNETLR